MSGQFINPVRAVAFNIAERSADDASASMPGLVPGIHVLAFLTTRKGVDGRDKPGHDGKWNQFQALAEAP